MSKNYILHFNGLKGLGAYYHNDKFKDYRVEINCDSDSEFMRLLFSEYNYIDAKQFYIDGEASDFLAVKIQTEKQAKTEAN